VRHWRLFLFLSHTGVLMIYVEYQNGKRLQGVLLALGGQWIRVAIQGSEDAVEYRLISGQWISEDCEVVTFKFNESGLSGGDLRELPPMFAGETDVTSAPRIM
jgi:hypothetical protein